MSTTADFIKRARARLKLTQAELAEMLGLERRSIMRYEKGDQLPPAISLAIKHLLHKSSSSSSKSRR